MNTRMRRTKKWAHEAPIFKLSSSFYLRHSEGTYLAAIVPLVPVDEPAVPAELQYQLIEPDVGGVPAVSALAPSRGAKTSVLEPEAATFVV